MCNLCGSLVMTVFPSQKLRTRHHLEKSVCFWTSLYRIKRILCIEHLFLNWGQLQLQFPQLFGVGLCINRIKWPVLCWHQPA